jgi:hypothetical protein
MATTKHIKEKDEVELDPKGWARFEQAVDAATKRRSKRKSHVVPERKKSRKR